MMLLQKSGECGKIIWPGVWPGVPALAPASLVCRPADRLPDRAIRSVARFCRLAHQIAQIFLNLIKTIV